MALTADRLHQLGIVETVIDEGEGAHLNPIKVMHALQEQLKVQLDRLMQMDADERCEARYQRLMKFGSNNFASV